jgi:hypothetical protein
MPGFVLVGFQLYAMKINKTANIPNINPKRYQPSK